MQTSRGNYERSIRAAVKYCCARKQGWKTSGTKTAGTKTAGTKNSAVEECVKPKTREKCPSSVLANHSRIVCFHLNVHLGAFFELYVPALRILQGVFNADFLIQRLRATFDINLRLFRHSRIGRFDDFLDRCGQCT